jgi:hypothetical protein
MTSATVIARTTRSGRRTRPCSSLSCRMNVAKVTTCDGPCCSRVGEGLSHVPSMLISVFQSSAHLLLSSSYRWDCVVSSSRACRAQTTRPNHATSHFPAAYIPTSCNASTPTFPYTFTPHRTTKTTTSSARNAFSMATPPPEYRDMGTDVQEGYAPRLASVCTMKLTPSTGFLS